MNSSPRDKSDVDRLAAPRESGAVLIWPSADTLAGLAEENRRRRAGWTIRWPGGVAPAIEGPPAIATGHQPELIHPGVWIKHVMAGRLTARLGGTATFVVVDSDLIDGVGWAVPQRVNDRWTVRRGAAFAARGLSFEQVPPRTDAQWRDWLAAAEWGGGNSDDASGWARFCSAFVAVDPAGGDGHSELSTGMDYVTRWSAGVRAVDRAVGVETPPFVRVSEIFGGPGRPMRADAAAFVAQVLLGAGEFAKTYNQALADYRARRGMVGNQHPVPDLAVTTTRVELPFWAVRGVEPRGRLIMEPTAGSDIHLYSGERRFATLDTAALQRDPATALAAALGENLLRPRALALTMFLRLLACDLFIHGIGGAKYDQISDAIIRDYFRVVPPPFACVTATALLPLGETPILTAVEDLRAARRRLRQAVHHPRSLLTESQAGESIVAGLLSRWGQAVSDSQRYAASSPKDRVARRGAYLAVQAARAEFARACPHLTADAQQAIAVAERAVADSRVTGSREWFVGLYPLAQLRALAERAAIP